VAENLKGGDEGGDENGEEHGDKSDEKEEWEEGDSEKRRTKRQRVIRVQQTFDPNHLLRSNAHKRRGNAADGMEKADGNRRVSESEDEDDESDEEDESGSIVMTRRAFPRAG
jgi:hypothetical protein